MDNMAAPRPWDALVAAGPPADALEFPAPLFVRGRRSPVLCYNPQTGSHELVTALRRDCSRHEHDSNKRQGSVRTKDDATHRMQTAYWPIPEKAPIRTNMGHVEIALVLERCEPQRDDDYESDAAAVPGSSNDSNNGGSGLVEASLLQSMLESTHQQQQQMQEQQAQFNAHGSAKYPGQGFDDVDDVVFQMTNECVAIKVNYRDLMEKLRNRHAEDPLKELAAMQLVGDRHRHVLGCKEALFDGENLNVVMRYCDGGALFELIGAPAGGGGQGMEFDLDDSGENADGSTPPSPGLPEGQARYWFRQIMKGVQFLHHTAGICHRDLSPENIMIDHSTGALIIDMGMCLRVPYSASNCNDVVDITHASTTTRRLFRPQGCCGKFPYMSPEIFWNIQPFDGAAADVWTVGTILFCMVTGQHSYQQPVDADQQFYWMSRRLPRLLGDWGVRLSPAGIHLLQNMLQVDPRLRLTIDEVMNHPWLQEPDETPMVMRQLNEFD
jgi:Protein kinase domain